MTTSKPASRGKRLAAALIDAAILSALVVLPSSAATWLVFTAVGAPVVIIVQWWLLMERGQTLGKLLVGVRVVLADTKQNGDFVTNVLARGGWPLSFLILNQVYYIPLLLFVVDSLFIFRRDQRCLHDLVAGTVVVDGQPRKSA